MDDDAEPAYLFTELTSLDELSFPASSSKRVKFTCVTASPRHLVLGTSSGTVYVLSRFRSKGRGRAALPPVEVFTTKDGSVSKIFVSPDEQNVAVGSDSGRVSIAALATSGLSTAIVYTHPGDARKTDRVTDLCWSRDSKLLYSGHMSGAVIAHQMTQSVFRTSNRQICIMDSEIIQLEINDSGKQLLISTTTSSFIYDLDIKSTNQVGKKTRNSKMGACFMKSEKEACEFICASRPNGRLWEANSVGVVYRTHQFRQSSNIPRVSIVSYRSSFKGSQKTNPEQELETAANDDVQLFLLYPIGPANSSFLLTAYGSKLLVFDTETSQVVLITDLGKEIHQFAVCGSDVFVILNTSYNTSAAVKLSLLSVMKAVEKLQLRGCHSQAAEIVTKMNGIKWEAGLVKTLINQLQTNRKKEKNTEALKAGLGKILEKMEINASTYDNHTENNEVSRRLSTGVHKVLCHPAVSGLEDDFTFRFTAPLRERSQSSPTVDIRTSLSPTVLVKQNSMPLTAEEVQICSRNGTPDVTEQDILERARNILEHDGHVVEADSLRTLLQFECTTPDGLRFAPQVTVANAAKALAELALVTPLDVSSILTVDRRVNASGTKRTGPTIVKPVKRQVSRPAPPSSKAAIAVISPEKYRKMSETMEKNSNIIEEDTTEDKYFHSDEQNNMDLEADWLERRITEIKTKTENGEKYPASQPSTSSDSESMTTTESGKDMKLESRETRGEEMLLDTNLCRHCGMHRSWLGLALLGTVCRRVTVEKSTKESVPSNSSTWSHLLLRRLKLPTSQESKICPRCEGVFASAGKALSKLPTTSGLTQESHKIDTKAIRERIKENGLARMEAICTGSPSQSKITYPDLLSPNSAEPTSKPSSPLLSPPPFSAPIVMEPKEVEENELPWLNRIEMNTLLFLCCLVLGYKGLLSLLKESQELAQLLEPSHWATLVSLAIREQQLKRDYISSTVVKDVLDPLRLEAFLSIPAAENSPSPRASISRRATPPTIYSWIIDVSGSCLICTLPLQTQVKGEDLPVITFQCSHTYHTKCLAGKTYCVACRVRARKMVITAGGSRPVARPLPIKK